MSAKQNNATYEELVERIKVLEEALDGMEHLFLGRMVTQCLLLALEQKLLSGGAVKKNVKNLL